MGSISSRSHSRITYHETNRRQLLAGRQSLGDFCIDSLDRDHLMAGYSPPSYNRLSGNRPSFLADSPYLFRTGQLGWQRSSRCLASALVESPTWPQDRLPASENTLEPSDGPIHMNHLPSSQWFRRARLDHPRSWKQCKRFEPTACGIRTSLPAWDRGASGITHQVDHFYHQEQSSSQERGCGNYPAR